MNLAEVRDAVKVMIRLVKRHQTQMEIRNGGESKKVQGEG